MSIDSYPKRKSRLFIKPCQKINYLKACIQFLMVTEEYTTLQRNVRDISCIKVFVAVVVLFHFFS